VFFSSLILKFHGFFLGFLPFFELSFPDIGPRLMCDARAFSPFKCLARAASLPLIVFQQLIVFHSGNALPFDDVNNFSSFFISPIAVERGFPPFTIICFFLLLKTIDKDFPPLPLRIEGKHPPTPSLSDFFIQTRMRQLDIESMGSFLKPINFPQIKSS